MALPQGGRAQARRLAGDWNVVAAWREANNNKGATAADDLIGQLFREGYLSEHEHERPRQFSLSVSTSTISASSLAVMGVTIDFMEHLYRRLNAEEHEGFNRFGRARNQPPTREAYEASKTGAWGVMPVYAGATADLAAARPYS